ncbi:LIP-domain-containing protein [Pseudovirgaria hyperparasitica]|uniref:LIP-domain-containing protein n=1 Tax=Pseudovirgaria hyperparasitica TaxID=470096 RepID=A0A6A6WED8_9PEZI|nr:LIP-domain-containing protein [Pseudovirgaria hyperparasitica]KAF2761188.1 LIP-domain-containing protein [Pseudovirgaria hyperparasitica]
MKLTTTLTLLSGITLSSAAALLSRVTIPSQDPFYRTPPNIASYSPGTVIDKRQVPPNLSGLMPNLGGNEKVEAVYQYLYRTTDALGNPAAAVTTLLKPFKADPTKLLAYQQAYDSAKNDCSPSYAIQSGANTTALADIIMIAAALDQGWYVVSSDYEGLNAVYTVGTAAGYATLDSVRAALNEAPKSAGLASNARYAMWGYSGGSLASEWAAELQPQYAPELKFQGVALGGLVPDIQSVLETINKGFFAGLAFSGIYGFIKAFPNLTEYANQHLIAEKKEEFFKIANGCLQQTASAGGNKDLFTYFDGGKELSKDPVPSSVLGSAGLMGVHGTPTMPMYVYKAAADEISPVADTDKLVDTLCGKGAIIEYRKNIIGEHISEAITGSASALNWISDRLNGKPVTLKKCVMIPVAITVPDFGTGIAIGKELIAAIKVLLGGNLGLHISG